MVQLRDELLKRLDAYRTVSGHDVIDAYVVDNDEWLAERLVQAWRLGDLPTTAQHYAERLRELGLTPERVVNGAIERERALVQRRGQLADELAAQVQNAFDTGVLRAEWRERVLKALTPNRL